MSSPVNSAILTSFLGSLSPIPHLLDSPTKLLTPSPMHHLLTPPFSSQTAHSSQWVWPQTSQPTYQHSPSELLSRPTSTETISSSSSNESSLPPLEGVDSHLNPQQVVLKTEELQTIAPKKRSRPNKNNDQIDTKYSKRQRHIYADQKRRSREKEAMKELDASIDYAQLELHEKLPTGRNKCAKIKTILCATQQIKLLQQQLAAYRASSQKLVAQPFRNLR